MIYGGYGGVVIFYYLCIVYFYAVDCVKCNDMYKRSEYQVIKRRLEEPRRFIQVVMGPRQIV